jgi:hypothetical protein
MVGDAGLSVFATDTLKHLQPAGAAVRGPQSAATLRCIGLLLFSTATSPLLAVSLACQNNNLATSDNYFKFKLLSECLRQSRS